MAGMTTSAAIAPAVPGARRKGMGMPKYAGGTSNVQSPVAPALPPLAETVPGAGSAQQIGGWIGGTAQAIGSGLANFGSGIGAAASGEPLPTVAPAPAPAPIPAAPLNALTASTPAPVTAAVRQMAAAPTAPAPAAPQGIDIINGGGFGTVTHQGGGQSPLTREDAYRMLAQPRITPQEQAQHDIVSAYQGGLQNAAAMARQQFLQDYSAAGGDAKLQAAAAQKAQVSYAAAVGQYVENLKLFNLPQLNVIKGLQQQDQGMIAP